MPHVSDPKPNATPSDELSDQDYYKKTKSLHWFVSAFMHISSSYDLSAKTSFTSSLTALNLIFFVNALTSEIILVKGT